MLPMLVRMTYPLFPSIAFVGVFGTSGGDSRLNGGVAVYALDPVTGAPTLLTGSPFLAGGNATLAPALDSTGHFLYVTNAYTRTASGYSVAANGALTPTPGSPFAAGQYPLWVTTFPASPKCAATIQPPIEADGSSVFNAKRGVVPVKFALELDGLATCQLAPATISVFRTAGGLVGQINESEYTSPSDVGTNFRISGCEYHYNLEAKAFGPGTYLVKIAVGNTVIGTASFALK
jgi:hypothetical protein